MFSIVLLGSCTQQQSPSQICDTDLVGYWQSSNNGTQGEPRIMFIGEDLTGSWVSPNPNFSQSTFGGTLYSSGRIGTYTLSGNSLTLTINQAEIPYDLQTWDFVK